MLTVLKLEMHLAYTCNLSCEGCNHYSNYGLKGLKSLQEGADSLRSWSVRVQPIHFSFLGGEPLLNPALIEFLYLGRELLTDTRLRLVTNGLLLPRWKMLGPALRETRTVLTVSMHSRDQKYVRTMTSRLADAAAASCTYGFSLDIRNCIDNWYRPHLGYGASMTPFTDGNPVASWNACSSRNCVTIERNMLWKCPPLAHLPRVAEHFSLQQDPAWAKYLCYKPLALNSTDEELRAFFSRGPESFCGMCPAKPRYFKKNIFRKAAKLD